MKKAKVPISFCLSIFLKIPSLSFHTTIFSRTLLRNLSLCLFRVLLGDVSRKTDADQRQAAQVFVLLQPWGEIQMAFIQPGLKELSLSSACCPWQGMRATHCILWWESQRQLRETSCYLCQDDSLPSWWMKSSICGFLFCYLRNFVGSYIVLLLKGACSITWILS